MSHLREIEAKVSDDHVYGEEALLAPVDDCLQADTFEDCFPDINVK